MADRPERRPDHFDPSTWRMCLVAGCIERVDPWEHHMRCATHRGPVELERRNIALATGDTVRQAIATETLYDTDYPMRLLDAIIDDAPNLVARLITTLQREARR